MRASGGFVPRTMAPGGRSIGDLTMSIDDGASLRCVIDSQQRRYEIHLETYRFRPCCTPLRPREVADRTSLTAMTVLPQKSGEMAMLRWKLRILKTR